MRLLHPLLSRLTALFVLPLVVATASAAPLPVTIDAGAAIYNADNPNAVVAGQPTMVVLPTATTGFTFTLGSSNQVISLDGGADYNDADGAGAAAPASASARSTNVRSSVVPISTNTGTRTLSGIVAPGAGYITGVFLGANQVGKPALIDYTRVGTGLPSYAPLLQQVFFIGDGLTGDGSGAQQTFFVPDGAVMLFLGISDADGYAGAPSAYGDNIGRFFGSINFITRAAVPEPGEIALLAIGCLALAIGRRRPR